MVQKRLIARLILLAVVLPIAQGVLYWVGLLLAATADTAGALLVSRVGLICGIVWVVDLIVLLVLVALATVGPTWPVEDDTDDTASPVDEVE